MLRRQRMAMLARQRRLALELEEERKNSIPDQPVDEDTPLFARPYRKDGRWYYRPPKPRWEL